MTRLREKLNSQRGAAILLALLLFLVCCMAAASVMAAAVSNAGKTRSSSVEQQKYLTLSSAIQLVADELERAEYTGRYNVWEWKETKTETSVDPSDPENPIETSYDVYYFYCEQIEGTYSCGDLTAQIPLGTELDKIFSQQFRAKGGAGAGFKPLTDTDAAGSTVVCKLAVALPDNLPGYSYSGTDYKAATTVTVQVELNYSTRHITLTAWLGESDTVPADKGNVMIAELVVKTGALPTLDYSPTGRKPEDPSGHSPTDSPRAVPTMKWELSSIKKGAA